MVLKPIGKKFHAWSPLKAGLEKQEGKIRQ